MWYLLLASLAVAAIGGFIGGRHYNPDSHFSLVTAIVTAFVGVPLGIRALPWDNSVAVDDAANKFLVQQIFFTAAFIVCYFIPRYFACRALRGKR